MGWKNWSNMIRGGIIVSLLSLFSITLTLFIDYFVFDGVIFFDGGDIIIFLAPIFYAYFVISFFSDNIILIILYLPFAVFLTLLQYFIIGLIFGFIYDISKHKKTVIFLLVTFSLIILLGLSYYTKEVDYSDYSSISDCDKFLSRIQRDFNIKSCYYEIAIKNKNIEICYLLKGLADHCYFEVSKQLKDYDICHKKYDNYYDKIDCIKSISIK